MTYTTREIQIQIVSSTILWFNSKRSLIVPNLSVSIKMNAWLPLRKIIGEPRYLLDYVKLPITYD